MTFDLFYDKILYSIGIETEDEGMRVLSFAVLFFVLLLIFACAFRMRKINYDYTNRVFSKLMYITSIVILLYAAAIAVNDQRQALVLYSLFFIFLDLMLLFMVLRA